MTPDLDPGHPSDVRYEALGPVTVITFQRPEALNAFTPGMHRQYRERLADAVADPAVGAIVVTGSGRGFCAGSDMRAVSSVADGPGGYPSGTSRSADARPGYGLREDFDRPLAYHLGIEKPIVAAINGGAAGLGFVLACYCDVRFAVPGAKLTPGFAPLGLPVEFGLSWLLPRLIGGSRANELLLSNRIFRSEEAAEFGLVHRVVPTEELRDEAVRYAADIAERCGPRALAMTKRQIYGDWLRDLAEAYDDAAALTNAATYEEEFRHAVAAAQAARPPRFRTSGYR